MEDLLRVLETYEIWIYVFLGIFGLWYFWKVLLAWREWRASLFGIEREIAQRRFSSAMTVLVLLVMLGMAEFLLVSFVAPDMPQVDILATPTINYFDTPIATLSTTFTPASQAAGIIPTLAVSNQDGCSPGKLEWTFPKDGDQVSGSITPRGTIKVSDLGYYKYEYSPARADKWITISAGNTPITDLALGGGGAWNTSQLVPGDYQLRLVVTDHQGQSLPACVITIRIVSP